MTASQAENKQNKKSKIQEPKNATAIKATKDVHHPSVLSSIVRALAMIASALVVLAAFRNSLTWHLQRFWGASGDFWQTQWNKVLDVLGDDPLLLWMYTIALVVIIYWTLGGMYILLDATNPSFIRKYKVQPGMNEPVSKGKLFNAIAWVLFNQAIAVPLSMVAYPLLKWRGVPDVHELPSFHLVLMQLGVHILIEEVAFYYSHRLLHHRSIYKYIHKKHHEWTAPIAVIAMYCHPIENIVSNITPLFLGVLATGAHVATTWLWFSMAIVNTLADHSGYHLPFMPSPEQHDFHHLKFNNCYGVLGLLDRLHGTDTQFRQSKGFERDIILTRLTPLRETYPDKDNKGKIKGK